jgi:pimeloyl-ACP methyl ester carboxylesterase
LLERLDWIVARRRSNVAILGHGRGGLIARVLARRHPGLVAAA